MGQYFPYKTFWNTVQLYKNMSIRYILVWSWRTCLMDKNVIRPSGIEFKWSSTFFFCRMKFKEWKNVPTIAILRSTYLRYWNWLKKVHKSYHLDPNEERGLGLRRTLQFTVIFHEAYEMISIGQDQVFSATFAFHLSNYREKKIIIVKFWKIAEQDKTLIKFLCKITQLSLWSKNLSNFILETQFLPRFKLPNPILLRTLSSPLMLLKNVGQKLIFPINNLISIW